MKNYDNVSFRWLLAGSTVNVHVAAHLFDGSIQLFGAPTLSDVDDQFTAVPRLLGRFWKVYDLAIFLNDWI